MRVILSLILLLLASSAVAQSPAQGNDEAAIRDVIADWYARLREPKRTHWQLFAPGAIDGGPGETELFPERRVLGPTVSNELAAQALTFTYDIDRLQLDTHFAKVIVWERGYFYAWANKVTYERGASALFVMEKQQDGRWLILAHEASSQGIPPNKKTVPLPDLEKLWRQGGQARFEIQPAQ